MIHLRDTLVQTLGRLPRLEGDFSPIVKLGLDKGYALAEFPPQILHRVLADAAADVEGADQKLEAAYLMGNVAFCLAEPLVGLAMHGHWLDAAHARCIALSPRLVTWEEEGEKGVDQVFDVGLAAAGLHFGATADTAAFAMAVEHLITSLVNTIHTATGLSKPALYMLVADSFGYAFLAHGRHLGCEDRAIALAMEVFGQHGTKLYSKKLRFDRITLPEAPHIGAWLRVRGGCCRAYTRPGKPNYCTTCVLRDDESRAERYRNYLRRTHLPQPPSNTQDT